MPVAIEISHKWGVFIPYRRPALPFQVDVVGEGEVVAGEAFEVIIGGVVDAFAIEEL